MPKAYTFWCQDCREWQPVIGAMHMPQRSHIVCADCAARLVQPEPVAPAGCDWCERPTSAGNPGYAAGDAVICRRCTNLVVLATAAAEEAAARERDPRRAGAAMTTRLGFTRYMVERGAYAGDRAPAEEEVKL